MNRVFITGLLVFLLSLVVQASGGILEKLRQIPQVSDIQALNVDFFEEYYQFWFEQPIDHKNPSLGKFKQKVLLGHKDMEAPVVAELEGYSIHSKNAGELTELFKANQLVIEHRFFDQSVPAGGIPWEHLTIRQAADDQHEIIQAVKKAVYPDSKWISTGISKGGQTTVFHRYFYPSDVDVSVPYVAPLNLEYVDPRLEKFLSKLGANNVRFGDVFEGGDTRQDCHYIIRDFQILVFKNLDRLLPMFEKATAGLNYSFETVGGAKRVLELVILEYPFAFWQWGASCDNVPLNDCEDMDMILEHLIKISTPEFFDDRYIDRMRPFFYGALTEMGMYDYNTRPFKKYLSSDKNIDFSFTMPKGVEQKPFNNKQMNEINRWLQTDAEKILFIYGGLDPWYATGVDLKKNEKCRKYVRGDAHHGCRIKDFDPVSKEDLISTLKEWLKK